MADPPTVVRFRGDGPDALAAAIAAVLRHARDTKDDFTFGPLRLDELERDGLQIAGPDLAGVMQVLATIGGLAHIDM